MTILRGGTFNVENTRPPRVVLGEVERFMDRHRLAFCCVQEFKMYRDTFEAADWCRVFAAAWPGKQGRGDTAILVRPGVPARNPAYAEFGDGWVTVEGDTHVPPEIPRVTVEWLRVASVHMPTPITWDGPNRPPEGPPERVDDYRACARKVRSFLADEEPRLVAGDWNESPRTLGRWAPGWIAKQVRGQAWPTGKLAGHGDIDYPVTNRFVKVVNIGKDLEIREGSDHEPVWFNVERTG